MKNILELLELNAERFPDKPAFIDMEKTLTYSQLLNDARRLGSGISRLGFKNRPIAVYIDKSADLIAAMLGVVYSGNFYAVIDTEMPTERVNRIFETLRPSAILTDKKHTELSSYENAATLYAEDLLELVEDSDRLSEIRKAQVDSDPLYTLYTSGSTGVPKGAVLSHKNVLSYIEWVTGEFGINEGTVFANQTPFYFSMSVTDVYSTIRSGATLVIVPKQYFSFPIKLVELMNEYKVNTLYWVPSAISIVSNMRVFDYAMPEYLRTVLFAGEVMPTKQLNYWINKLSDEVVFANLFGPTEATDICTFYRVNRKFRDDEPLPIGNACDNCDVFIVGDDGKAADEGELYIRGTFLASGYYNNPDKTAEAFVQNPLNSSYPEICYKTGDLVRLNEYGELMYKGRKDFQIKHMGYRIELGEIETAASAVEGMKECACVYDADNDKIVMFYSASRLKEDALFSELKSRLNDYLLPNRLVKLRELPHNANGKIDRKELKTQI